jgi:hypothetical protein
MLSSAAIASALLATPMVQDVPPRPKLSAAANGLVDAEDDPRAAEGSSGGTHATESATSPGRGTRQAASTGWHAGGSSRPAPSTSLSTTGLQFADLVDTAEFWAKKVRD